MRALVDRIRREPALLAATAVAVLNLAGADPATIDADPATIDQAAAAIETAALLVIGLTVRSQYTPLANRGTQDDDR